MCGSLGTQFWGHIRLRDDMILTELDGANPNPQKRWGWKPVASQCRLHLTPWFWWNFWNKKARTPAAWYWPQKTPIDPLGAGWKKDLDMIWFGRLVVSGIPGFGEAHPHTTSAAHRRLDGWWTSGYRWWVTWSYLFFLVILGHNIDNSKPSNWGDHPEMMVSLVDDSPTWFLDCKLDHALGPGSSFRHRFFWWFASWNIG